MRPRAALIELRRDLAPVLRGERASTDDEARRLAALVVGRHERDDGSPWPVDSRTRLHALELALALRVDVGAALPEHLENARLDPRTLRVALRDSIRRAAESARANDGVGTPLENS